MIVLTIDQQGSRRGPDQVPAFLAAMATRLGQHDLVRPFERTVGDEVQAVLEDPWIAIDTALILLRWGGWSVGIGSGPVDVPLPASTREGSGTAFILAREAVERAKSRARPVPLAVGGANQERGTECDALLTLIGSVIVRRSRAGWAVTDALQERPGMTQDEVAERLGISQQAVSQRLRAALWTEEQAVRPLAARLLQEAGQ